VDLRRTWRLVTIPGAEAAAKVVAIRLSAEELRHAAEAAQVNRQTVSSFVREAILDATAECLTVPGSPNSRGSGVW